MPRKARPTQAIAAPQDQGYGQRGEQMAAQHAIPLPNNAGQTANGLASAPAAPTGPPALDLNAALQAAQGMAPPQGGLDRPSDRPGEPVTSGIASGPGPGPSSTNGVDPVLDYLRQAFAIDRSDAIAALIERAGG